MALMATQSGTVKKVASRTEKVTSPAFETITIDGSATYDLAHVPTEDVSRIYLLNGDSTIGTIYTANTAASATQFIFAKTEGKATITPPTGLVNGDQLFVIYEYEAESAVEVTNAANKFPVGCKFILEVLGCDVCDQTNLIYAYIIFPNAKLSPDFDWSIATDSTHPFSLTAMQDYCSREKVLFKVVIPE